VAVVWFAVPLLLWSAVVLPATAGAVWGSLDDGVALTLAEQGPAFAFDGYAGRLVPTHWLNNWLFYQLGGTDPTIWYAGHALEILLALAFVHACVTLLTGAGWAGALAASNLATVSSIGTNAYFLSNTETRVVLFGSALALLIAVGMRGSASSGSRASSPVFWTLMTLAGLLTVFSKEAGITLVLVGLAGWIASHPRLGLGISAPTRRLFGGVLLLLLVIDLVWLGLKLGLRISGAGGIYTDFAPRPESVIANLRFYFLNGTDVVLLGGAALVVAVSLAILHHWDAPHSGRSRDRQAFVWGWLMVAVSYAALLLLWRWGLNYYLLPVALFLTLVLGVGLPDLVARTLHRGSAKRRGFATGALVVSIAAVAASKAYSLPFIHYAATAQRTFDRLEARIQGLMLERSPPAQRVVDVDRTWFVEAPLQRSLLFDHLGRPDLEWVGAGEIFIPYDEDQLRLFHASGQRPVLEERPLQQGDLVLVHGIDYPIPLGVRAIGPGGFVSRSGIEGRVEALEERTGRALRLIDRAVRTHAVLTPWSLRPRVLSFETRLLCVEGPPRVRVAWHGRWEDAWIGDSAGLEVEVPERVEAGALHVRALPVPEVLPVEVMVSNDLGTRRRVTLALARLHGELPLAPFLRAGRARLTITASPTWQPIRVNPASRDERHLGVQVDYEPATSSVRRSVERERSSTSCLTVR
jgi:hypothetical protein